MKTIVIRKVLDATTPTLKMSYDPSSIKGVLVFVEQKKDTLFIGDKIIKTVMRNLYRDDSGTLFCVTIGGGGKNE